MIHSECSCLSGHKTTHQAVQSNAHFAYTHPCRACMLVLLPDIQKSHTVPSSQQEAAVCMSNRKHQAQASRSPSACPTGFGQDCSNLRTHGTAPPVLGSARSAAQPGLHSKMLRQLLLPLLLLQLLHPSRRCRLRFAAQPHPLQQQQ